MSENKITLAGVGHELTPIPLGILKKVVPAFNRCASAFTTGVIAEDQFDDIALIISSAIGKSLEEVENIPAPMEELVEAIGRIAEFVGLKPRGGGQPGEDPAVTSIGMNSTPG